MQKLEREARALQIFIPAPSSVSHSGEFPRLREDDLESGRPDSAQRGNGKAARWWGVQGRERDWRKGSRCSGSSGRPAGMGL